MTRATPRARTKPYFEMHNLDWIQHAKGCACDGCTAFGKVVVKMLEHMATSEYQETRLVGFHSFHLTAWLNGTLNDEKLT